MNTRRLFSALRDGQYGTFALALLLLLAAVFLPRIELPRSTYDYVVVFDLTQSMNVEDYELDGTPISRLDFAKHAVRAALPELPCGSRVGWGTFAEYRTVVLLAPVEICSSYNDLLASLDKIDGRMRWSNASEITKGVFWSMRAARNLDTQPNVVFLSDGQEAPPLDSTRQAVAIFDDITVGAIDGWIVGIGGDTPRPIPRTDEDGNRVGFWHADQVIQRATDHNANATISREHLSSLHESHLRSLATQVGFQYHRLTDAESIKEVFHDPRFATRTRVPTDIGWLPAAAALLVLVWRFRPSWKQPPIRAS